MRNNDMNKMSATQVLAENLKSLMRSNVSLNTQTKLSAKSGIGQSSISRIIRAETHATLDTVETIATTFKVPTANLLVQNQDFEQVLDDPDIIEVVNIMHQLSESERSRIRGRIEQLAESILCNRKITQEVRRNKTK